MILNTNIPTFWLAPAGRHRFWLRRYSRGIALCPATNLHWHNAENLVLEREDTQPFPSLADFRHDARWPTHCRCGFAFDDKDDRQLFPRRLWRAPDGKLYTSDDAPPGALTAIDGNDFYWKGADGLTVRCKLPNGRWWVIDSRASNCTLRDDSSHRCWVRHGTIGDRLHVDKNGKTCAAGAGSIWSAQGTPDEWHGFLHNGMLVRC